MSLKKKLDAMKRQIEAKAGGWDAHLEEQGYRTAKVLKRPTAAAKPTTNRRGGNSKKAPTG